MDWTKMVFDYAPKVVSLLTAGVALYKGVRAFLASQSPRRRAMHEFEMLAKLRSRDLEHESPKSDARLEYWWGGMREGSRNLSASEIRYLSNIRPVSRAWRDYSNAYENLRIEPGQDGVVGIQVRSVPVMWGASVFGSVLYLLGSFLLLLPFWVSRSMTTLHDLIGGVVVACTGIVSMMIGIKGISFSGSMFRIVRMQEEANKRPAPWLPSRMEAPPVRQQLEVVKTRDDLDAIDENTLDDPEKKAGQEDG